MATTNSRNIKPEPTPLRLEGDLESEGSEATEANPLIRYDSYHHIKPISPTPIDSMRSEDIPTTEPLKTAPNTFIFTHAGHYFTVQQLVTHINFVVMNYVTQHNNMIHNPDTLLSSQDIQCTLRKLHSQLLADTDETDAKLIPTKHAAINDPLESTPMKFFNSIDIAPVALKCGASSEPPSIPLTRKCSHEISILKQSHSSNDDQHKIEEFRRTKEKLKWCTHSFRSDWNQYIPSSALLHHPSYSIAVDKYCGKLRGSVRQDWNTIETDDDEERNWEELKPHWFELFFDLMFVAAIVHISSEVAEAYEHHEYLFIYSVFPQFGLLILCWLQQVLYHSRFRMTQTGDGLLRFLYMSLVLLMGLSIGNMKNETSQNLFLISYMCTKIIMCMMFMKSALILRARAHSIYMIIENLMSILAIIVVVVCVNIDGVEQYDEFKWFWCLVYSVLFIYSWIYITVLVYAKCIRDLGINIPINVPHIAERMGAFVLIILGETIISIMVQHVESTMEGILTAYGVTMSLFIIVYSIGKLYFESQPSEHELHHHKKSHALSSSVWRARIYKWFHIVLFFGLLGLGLGCKITVHELPHYHMDDAAFIFIPAISCVAICFAINIIRLTHPFDYSEHQHLMIFVWFVRVLCMVLMLAILFAWKAMHHFIIMSVYVICFVLQIIVDFEARKRLTITKEVDKDKSMLFYTNKSTRIPKNVPDDNVVEMTTTANEMSFIGAF